MSALAVKPPACSPPSMTLNVVRLSSCTLEIHESCRDAREAKVAKLLHCLGERSWWCEMDDVVQHTRRWAAGHLVGVDSQIELVQDRRTP